MNDGHQRGNVYQNKGTFTLANLAANLAVVQSGGFTLANLAAVRSVEFTLVNLAFNLATGHSWGLQWFATHLKELPF